LDVVVFSGRAPQKSPQWLGAVPARTVVRTLALLGMTLVHVDGISTAANPRPTVPRMTFAANASGSPSTLDSLPLDRMPTCAPSQKHVMGACAHAYMVTYDPGRALRRSSRQRQQQQPARWTDAIWVESHGLSGPATTAPLPPLVLEPVETSILHPRALRAAVVHTGRRGLFLFPPLASLAALPSLVLVHSSA
jgi:hypothetical protein